MNEVIDLVEIRYDKPNQIQQRYITSLSFVRTSLGDHRISHCNVDHFFCEQRRAYLIIRQYVYRYWYSKCGTVCQRSR